MKHTKKIAALLALVLSLTTLWGCTGKEPEPPVDDPNPGEEQQQQQQQQNTVITAPSASIVCCDGETTLRFIHDAQAGWQWKDDTQFPLDATYPEALALCVEQMTVAQPVATDKTVEDLELDSAEKYVTVTDELGHRLTWYLGIQDDEGRYYMCLAGDETETVYLAPAELSDLISRSIYDMMILPQLQPIMPENVRKVTITAGEKTVTTFLNNSGVWVVDGHSVTAKAAPMTQGLGQMAILSCVDFNPTEGAAAICGFEPPQATVTVEFLNLVGVEQSLSFTIGAKLGEGYCMTMGGDSTIYLMSSAAAEPILDFMK